MKSKKNKEKLNGMINKEFTEIAKVVAIYAGVLGGVKLLQNFANRDVE